MLFGKRTLSILLNRKAEPFGEFPVSAIEIEKRATRGFTLSRYGFRLKKDAEGQWYIKIIGPHFEDSYFIDLGRKVIGPGDIKNRKSDRATGRKLMANRALLGLGIGVTQCNITAGDTMGGYVWARAGLKVTPGSREFLATELHRRLDLLGDRIDADIYSALHHDCCLKDDDALYRIASIDSPLPYDEAMFAAALASTVSSVYGEPRDYSQSCWLKDSFTVSKHMLCGLTYETYLDLHNAVQMDRFEKYTGVPVRALDKAMRPQPSMLRKILPARFRL